MERRNTDIDRRARLLRPGRSGRGPVVYWMSREMRVQDNWPLLFARQEALLRQRPLEVVFCLDPGYPGANERHFAFLLRGLAELSKALQALNITFSLLPGPCPQVLPPHLQAIDAALLVQDTDPLRIKRQWSAALCTQVEVAIHQVDGHNVVPVWLASDKKEYGAYTLRPKLQRLVPDYLTPFPPLEPHPFGRAVTCEVEVARWVSRIHDRSVPEVATASPGEAAATAAMDRFLRQGLARYGADRNDPCQSGQSGLSAYLHFGHLAPQRLAYEVAGLRGDDESRAAFLEELVVRRELADNYCWYEPDYDRFAGFPEWARKTLDAHRQDRREYLYSRQVLEQGTTHDHLWNACQQDLIRTGRLHGYLRMYWAKKLLEWTETPEEAQETAIVFNDRYLLDGRDANGYTGIAWSIGGVHDRAWKERPIFGKIRYMNLAGCRRKFDVDGFLRVRRQSRLPRKVRLPGG